MNMISANVVMLKVGILSKINNLPFAVNVWIILSGFLQQKVRQFYHGAVADAMPTARWISPITPFSKVQAPKSSGFQLNSAILMAVLWVLRGLQVNINKGSLYHLPKH